MSSTQSLGHLGENLAANYLTKHGYAIRQTNYRVREGEIDIIAEKNGVIHFVEVKARANGSFGLPENAVDDYKLEKIAAACYQYIDSNNIDADWQIDVIAIIFNFSTNLAKIKLYENIG